MSDARRAVHALAWLAATLTVSSATACEATSDASNRPVIVGMAALRISLPAFVADERGLYAEHGIDVDRRAYETAQPMIDDLAHGRLDAAGFAAWPIVLLASQRSNLPLLTVASIVEDSEHRLSYVLRRRGSTLRFPVDVRGKRIGILPTIAYRRWLEAILRTESIEPADVTIVPIAPPMQAQSLEQGGVDLLFTGDPMATAMLASGRAEVADDGPPCATRLGDPFEFGTFIISGRLARDRPDVARRLVLALDEAIGVTRSNPELARRALRKALRPAERAWVERYPPTRYRNSNETPPGIVAQQIRWAQRWRILHGGARVDSWRP